MASICQLLPLSCKIVSATRPKPSSSSSQVRSRATVPFVGLKLFSKQISEKNHAYVVRSTEGGDSTATETSSDSKDVDSLKQELYSSLSGTDCGLNASSKTRSEILEIVSQLEAKNPNAAPTQSLSLLNGKWILVYTSFVGFFPLMMSFGVLPLVKVNGISQTIDSDNLTVQNIVHFGGPLASTSLSTSATFEVKSPKRVQIKFLEGAIGTPQLTDSIELPENVEFMGRPIDLTLFKNLISSVQDTASGLAKSMPPIKFPMVNTQYESWLLTTYLDEDLRISRGDCGSVFVLFKEGSSFLATTTTGSTGSSDTTATDSTESTKSTKPVDSSDTTSTDTKATDPPSSGSADTSTSATDSTTSDSTKKDTTASTTATGSTS